MPADKQSFGILFFIQLPLTYQADGKPIPALRQCFYVIHHIKEKIVFISKKFVSMNSSGRLTNLQIELLKMFNYDLAENQLKDIRNILGKYFAETARTEMDKLWEQEGWSDETMEQWANEHLRKKG